MTHTLHVQSIHVTQGEAEGPTWTILALSMRASEYVMEELKKQNL